MLTEELVAINRSGHFVSTRLLSVYDTNAQPPHSVCLKDKKMAMNCLILTLDGEGYVKSREEKTWNLKKNSVYFGMINHMDSMYCKKLWHYLCYWYEAFGKEFPFDMYYQLDDLDVEKEEKEIKAIIELLLTGKEEMVDQANALFTYKLIALINQMENNSVFSITPFEKMIVFINKRLQENITVDDIASEFGYTKKHVYYLFKKKMGVAPGAYMNKMKLERICGLLLTNSYTLSELAEHFGYASSSHLIYNFKKEYNCTPKQFQLMNNIY